MSASLRFQFRTLAKKLAADGEVAALAAHGSTTGTEREVAFHRFLSTFLPKSLRLGAGVITDSMGARSKQQDCIVYDPSVECFDLGSGANSLFLAESVLATIEIKSYLDSGELAKSLASTLQTRALTRNAEQRYHKGPALVVCAVQPILSYVFAYDGMTVDTIAEKVAESAHEHGNGWAVPDGICVLNRGVILRSSKMPVVRRGEGPNYTATLPDLSKPKLSVRPLLKDALLAFYERLRDDVFPLRLQNTDTDAYFSSEGAE